NDIQRASEIARSMVTKWGLSEKMGPLMYDNEPEEVFLGRSAAGASKVISAETAKNIDSEVRRIIDECYACAKQLLEENRDKLEMMAEALMLYETITAAQIDEIMAGRKPKDPSGWHDDSSSSGGGSTDSSESTVNKQRSDDSIGGPAGEH
ncbi:MAG: ATP-dependent metalloprotease, partial [Spongiibacteraceae bacterium]|nr:ATP-dependent metalloprotease [Spongiibacteraceae bacterium]